MKIPDCEHEEFKNGICEDCGFECDHPDVEELHCLECGKFIEPFDLREEPESMEER